MGKGKRLKFCTLLTMLLKSYYILHLFKQAEPAVSLDHSLPLTECLNKQFREVSWLETFLSSAPNICARAVTPYPKRASKGCFASPNTVDSAILLARSSNAYFNAWTSHMRALDVAFAIARQRRWHLIRDWSHEGELSVRRSLPQVRDLIPRSSRSLSQIALYDSSSVNSYRCFYP